MRENIFYPKINCVRKKRRLFLSIHFIMSGASNENEDPLKRTMALIDEHKDKFGDGCYLEIANNLHKAWSERARYFHHPQSAFPTVSGERETRTTRGTSTRREDFDPETGLPLFIPPRRRPMTLTARLRLSPG